MRCVEMDSVPKSYRLMALIVVAILGAMAYDITGNLMIGYGMLIYVVVAGVILFRTNGFSNDKGIM